MASSFHLVILPSKILAMVSASMFRVLPLPDTPWRLNTTAIGEMYTGTSKAVPEAHTFLDCATSSSEREASEPAHAVAPVRKVETPAPEPEGLYATLASGLVPWKPAIQASTAACWEEAPAPSKLPEMASVLVSDLVEVSVEAVVLSPQAATEASITMPDTAAMERTRMELRIIFPSVNIRMACVSGMSFSVVAIVLHDSSSLLGVSGTGNQKR